MLHSKMLKQRPNRTCKEKADNARKILQAVPHLLLLPAVLCDSSPKKGKLCGRIANGAREYFLPQNLPDIGSIYDEMMKQLTK